MNHRNPGLHTAEKLRFGVCLDVHSSSLRIKSDNELIIHDYATNKLFVLGLTMMIPLVLSGCGKD